MTSENWAERRGKKPLEAQQISARVGDLLYTPRGESLTLADPAVLYLEGAIAVLRGIGRKMAEHVNHLGQPIGFPLPAWTARPRPPRTAMEGRFCVVEPVDPARHAADLHAAYLLDKEGRNWTYLPHGPYARFEDYRARLEHDCLDDDRLIHAIVERRSGHAVGVASLMRIDPAAGVIEVGGINYAPPLQRTPAATEAMYLMMRRVFDELGYRRYEWKCDSLNAPSRAAAQRLGFRYEGMFRQATVYKARNRDTCWFSILDSEWPALKTAFQRWLDPGNFDAAGRQQQSLSSLRPSASA